MFCFVPIEAGDDWQSNLKVIAGAAERRLDGRARRCVEVAPHRRIGAVVADFVQRLRLRRREVTPAGKRFHCDSACDVLWTRDSRPERLTSPGRQ